MLGLGREGNSAVTVCVCWLHGELGWRDIPTLSGYDIDSRNSLSGFDIPAGAGKGLYLIRYQSPTCLLRISKEGGKGGN